MKTLRFYGHSDDAFLCDGDICEAAECWGREGVFLLPDTPAARQGLSALSDHIARISGSAFLLSLLFVAPFVLIIPDAATSCALVYVGVVSLVPT